MFTTGRNTHHEALPLLARLAENVRDIDSARLFVGAASRLGRDAEVLAACARARTAGIDDPYLVSVEVRLLDRYDPDRALALLDELMQRHPNEHRARVHFVSLAQRVGRIDLVDRELDRLPAVSAIEDPEEGAAVVRALLTAGRSVAATAFAYDLLRRFFTSPHSHRAFIHAVLWRDRSEEAPDSAPATVTPGTAVCLREVGGREDRWIVLEDSSVVAGSLDDEISSTHELWARLVGRRVGEQIDLGSGPGLSRRAGVVEIVPKATFRFRDAMSQWQYRFPEHQELWMVRVGDDETGTFDPSQLLEVGRARRDQVKHVEGVYQAQRVPLAMLGRALGTDVFRGTLHAAFTPGLRIRCCLGSAEERDAAIASLDAASEIVVDGTALATLYALDLVDALSNTGKRILVGHALMSVVRAFSHDARTTERASASMGVTDSGPVLHVYTDGVKENYRVRTATFTARVEEVAVAAPSLELAGMNGDKRRQLGEVFDETTLDALAIASVPGRVIWTDDFVVASLGRSELGTTSTWTQAVLLWLLQRGLLTETRYTEASARLVALGYTFTSLSPAVLAQAARLASWNADASPLREVVAQLGHAEARPEDGAQLGALLVRDAFTEPLPIEARQRLLFAVCATLAARSDGDRTLAFFERVLGRVFGLNAVGHEQALAALRAWKSAPRLIIAGAQGGPL